MFAKKRQLNWKPPSYWTPAYIQSVGLGRRKQAMQEVKQSVNSSDLATINVSLSVWPPEHIRLSPELEKAFSTVIDVVNMGSLVNYSSEHPDETRQLFSDYASAKERAMHEPLYNLIDKPVWDVLVNSLDVIALNDANKGLNYPDYSFLEPTISKQLNLNRFRDSGLKVWKQQIKGTIDTLLRDQYAIADDFALESDSQFYLQAYDELVTALTKLLGLKTEISALFTNGILDPQMSKQPFSSRTGLDLLDTTNFYSRIARGELGSMMKSQLESNARLYDLLAAHIVEYSAKRALIVGSDHKRINALSSKDLGKEYRLRWNKERQKTMSQYLPLLESEAKEAAKLISGIQMVTNNDAVKTSYLIGLYHALSKHHPTPAEITTPIFEAVKIAKATGQVRERNLDYARRLIMASKHSAYQPNLNAEAAGR